MHHSTFQYLKPTDAQMDTMAAARYASEIYAGQLENLLPNGVDKDYAIRKLRELAMWCNVCITRYPDGTPRD